jgi:hypothetical protein
MDPMQPFDTRCRKPAAGDKVDTDRQELARGVKINAPHVEINSAIQRVRRRRPRSRSLRHLRRFWRRQPTDKHFVWELTDARPDGGGRHDLLAILMISLARCRRPANHYAALHSMSPMLADPGLESSRLVPSGSDYDPIETSPSLVSIETEQLQI